MAGIYNLLNKNEYELKSKSIEVESIKAEGFDGAANFGLNFNGQSLPYIMSGTNEDAKSFTWRIGKNSASAGASISINVAGDGTQTSTMTATNFLSFTGTHVASCSDVASSLPAGIGSVVTLDSVVNKGPTTNEYVVSQASQHSPPFGVYVGEHHDDGKVLVASLGDGAVKVNKNGGDVSAGDYLINSSDSGYVYAPNPQPVSVDQTIVAKALVDEDFSSGTSTDANGVEYKVVPCIFLTG